MSETYRIAIAGALTILGFITIITGTVRITNSFRDPFDIPFAPEPDALTQEERDKEQLSGKDTDTDGLNDYDELYVYNTSPYLSDSDSDGTDDGDEITAGEDPNCPSGQDCYGAILELKSTSPLSDVPGAESQNTFTETDIAALFELLPENPAPEDIRGLLREAGFEEELLSQFTDEELIDVYQQTLNEFSNE